MTAEPEREESVPESEGRRDFLRQAGKFAAVTPPAIVVLFSTSLEAKATAPALSGGAHGPIWKHGPYKKYAKESRKKRGGLLHFLRSLFS